MNRDAIGTEETTQQDADLILVGGGLANLLIAWRLRQRQPALRVLVLEQADRLGGSHTWSFFETDMTPAQRDWIAPLVAVRWPYYHVRFPTHSRRLETAYASITAEHLHAACMAAMPGAIRLNATVIEVQPTAVRLADGTLRAPLVIDGRGYLPDHSLQLAYQKFVGLEVELQAPHGLAAPLLMDATVAQTDGYRFVYTLPLSERRLLIEDTYYSAAPGLDQEALRDRIHAYAVTEGWQIARTLREESGVLPLVLSGDIDAFWQASVRQGPVSGLRAGLFHPLTGYSLPEAVALADALAGWPLGDAAALQRRLVGYAKERWRRQGFLRLLCRMLFMAGPPSQRYRVLQRFYRLPRALVERFYAGRLNSVDRVRILAGRPPVPILGALSAMLNIRKEPS